MLHTMRFILSVIYNTDNLYIEIVQLTDNLIVEILILVYYQSINYTNYSTLRLMETEWVVIL